MRQAYATNFQTPTSLCRAQNRKPHREVGLSHQITFGLAVVLTLLVLLTTLAGPRRLLLLLLAGLLLSAALLLATLLLTALLLLAGLLVWILIHRTFLSNVDLKRHVDHSRSMAKDNAWWLHSFPFIGPLNFDENVFGTRLRQCEFHIRKNGGANDGTLHVALATWSTNSDSRIDLVIWRAALRTADANFARQSKVAGLPR